MTPVGFVGGSHATPNLDSALIKAGAKVVLTDMRQLKGTVTALRGW